MTDYNELLVRIKIQLYNLEANPNKPLVKILLAILQESAEAIRALQSDIKQITETNLGLQKMYYERGDKIEALQEQVKELKSIIYTAYTSGSVPSIGGLTHDPETGKTLPPPKELIKAMRDIQ